MFCRNIKEDNVGVDFFFFFQHSFHFFRTHFKKGITKEFQKIKSTTVWYFLNEKGIMKEFRKIKSTTVWYFLNWKQLMESRKLKVSYGFLFVCLFSFFFFLFSRGSFQNNIKPKPCYNVFVIYFYTIPRSCCLNGVLKVSL